MPNSSNRPVTPLRGSRRLLPPPPHGCRQKVLHSITERKIPELIPVLAVNLQVT